MKKNFLLISLFLLVLSSWAEKPKFLLVWSVKSEDNASKDILDLFCDSFEGEFNHSMDEYFPCASYTSYANIASVISNERDKQLLGAGDETAIQSLAGSMGAHYLVTLKLTQMGQSVFMNAICLNMLKPEMIVNVIDNAPLNEDAFEGVKRLAGKFFDELLKYEICPYTGKIKVEVLTDQEKDENKEFPVYCNGQDRTYEMHLKKKNHSDNYWTFEKFEKIYAKAYIDYNISEESEEEVTDGCYNCPSGKTRRYTRETISKSGKITEVSEESELEGKKINDARTEITFNDNGTYIIKIDATSKETDISETRYKYAESWCDSNNKPAETIQIKVDVPLTYIFGPYPGTARDESLTQHPDPIVEINSVTGEKTTYIISFDLARE